MEHRLLHKHEEYRDPSNRKRKKPINGELATATTPLGPNSTSHEEWAIRTTHATMYSPEGLVRGRHLNSKGSVLAQVPRLSAWEDYQVSANRSAALNKALGKIKDQKINLAVSLAELPETIGMFVSAAKVMIQMYKKAKLREIAIRKALELQRRSAGRRQSRRQRRLKPEKEKDLLKELSSLWLGYRYGIMPLVYDLQGALEELERVKTPINSVQKIKTSSKWEHSSKTYDFLDPIEYPSPSASTLERSVTHSVVINYRVVNPRTALQLGFTNGLEVLWEITPLSFVVDWVLNIGETLSTLDATMGTLFVSGTVSEKSESRVIIPSGSRTFNQSYGWYFDLKEVEIKGATGFTKTYKREVLTDFPSPQFYISNNMNKKRYLDAFALLKTILFSTK